MAIGNHELYIFNNTLDMHKNFAPKLKGRYLTSNVNITVPGTTTSVPVGSRFAKFKTLLGRKVTAYGVLFDFTGNDEGTIVQPVADMVKEQWFIDSLREEPAFFLLAGHMPLQKDNWPVVISAIRAVHKTTPIVVFGGHSHIRDCTVFEDRAVGIQAGRYMETVGWMSVNLDKKGSTKPLQFSRRYLDPNRATYKFHSTNLFFDTPLGSQITKGMAAVATKFNLSVPFGTAPQDFFLSRVAYPDPSSVVTLFINDVLPTTLKAAFPERASIPSMVFANSGSQRFDLFSGPFTVNDQFIVSPFDDKFLFLPNVPLGLAKKLVDGLNGSGLPSKRSLTARRGAHVGAYERGDVDAIFNAWTRDMYRRGEALNVKPSQNLTLGYVTTDTCPGVGDDTIHAPAPFEENPDFVASPAPEGVSDDATIDVIMLDFIESSVITVLNQLAGSTMFDQSMVQPYGSLATNEVFGRFAQIAWN
ncbi:Metallo-dependent phosphatase [Exidia glandulosa HHB12029]|uniref:Metallo-dependent phosphatase n=1 Tax=Exidia glandulosa HHB12029 TaxID=1314781 RepID=A0A165MVF9_EXIGL|nr:Metallo-dependent phosphatase [Exidia glandulosa HHB12029]